MISGVYTIRSQAVIFVLCALLFGCKAGQLAPLAIRMTASVEIEETDTALISSVNSLDVSPDGTKVLIGDASGGGVFLYSLKSGRLLRHFQGYPGLGDSLARNMPSPFYTGTPGCDTVVYYTRAQYYKIQPNPADETRKFLEQSVVQRLGAAFFKTDTTIVIAANVKTFMQNHEDVWAGAATAILTYSLSREHPSFVLPLWRGYFCTLAYDGFWDGLRKSYLMSAMDISAFDSVRFDSAVTLVRVDTNGNVLAKLCSVPSECKIRRLGYSYHRNLVGFAPDRSIFVGYGPSLEIRNLSSGASFNLKLPKDNSRMFELMRKYSAHPKLKVVWDSLALTKPVTVWSLGVRPSGNIIVCSAIADPQHNLSWYVQEYTEDGDLKAQTILGSPTDKLEAVFYSSAIDDLIVLRHTKHETWEMIRYSL